MIAILFSVLLSLLTSFSWAFNLNDLDMDKVVSGGSKLAKGVGGISDADEIKLGREVAANLAARYGLVEDAAKVRYVNLVGLAVAKQSTRAAIPYHFGILRTSEVNALAAPGGYIFVTQGLLDGLKDEAELAGILAHEVTHVARRHIMKAVRQANVLGAGQDFASATGVDANQFGQLTDFSINLLSKGLSRTDELEADKLGTILAAQVGYDPKGLRRSIEDIAARQKTSIFLTQFNKTHPPAADRLKAIDQAIRKNHLTKEGQVLPERLTQGLHS